jgi:hypothetical protein
MRLKLHLIYMRSSYSNLADIKPYGWGRFNCQSCPRRGPFAAHSVQDAASNLFVGSCLPLDDPFDIQPDFMDD